LRVAIRKEKVGVLDTWGEVERTTVMCGNWIGQGEREQGSKQGSWFFFGQDKKHLGEPDRTEFEKREREKKEEKKRK